MNKFNSADKLDPSATSGLKFWETFMQMNDADLMELLAEYGPGALDRAQKIALFKRSVAIINLETSSKCNRFCTYCPDSRFDRTRQNLLGRKSWQRVLSNVKEMQYARQISLNLYNEPMLDPSIFDKIAELKKASPSISTKISSNGDYLNEGTLGKLNDAGLSEAYVTLHQPAGKDYEDDRQLGYFDKFFKRCGIKNPPDLEIIAGKKIHAEFMAGDIRMVLMANNWGDFGNDRAGTVVNLRQSGVREAPCMRVFREFTISHEGEVFPCCQFFPDAPTSKTHVLAHMDRADMWDVYCSVLAARWRRSMFDFGPKAAPCDSCADLDNADPRSQARRLHLLDESNTSN